MKGKLVRVLIGVLVVAVIGGTGYFGYSYYSASKKTTVTATNYVSMQASKTKLTVNVQGTGTVIAESTRDIAPSAAGQLKDFNVKVGDQVNAGDKLGTISSDQIASTVAKAQNNVSKQQLQLTTLQNSLSNAQSQLAAAQADLNDAKAQLATAKTEDIKALNDRINSDQNQITSQTNSIANFQNQIASQKISISDAQNDLNSSIAQRNSLDIISPINGVVTTVSKGTGDSVQQGTTVLSVVDPASYKIKVSVDELDIAKVKSGAVTQITFGALKDKTYTGKVDKVSLVGTTTNNVTTYDVTIALDNTEGVIMGMTASVNIEVASKEDALVIPAEALVEKDSKKYVMIPNDDSQSSNSQTTSNSNNQGQKVRQAYGSGKLVEIKTGLENENYIEVTEGVTEGQKVLVSLPKSTSGTTTQNTKQSGLGGTFGTMGGNSGGIPSGVSGNRPSQSSGGASSK